MNISLMNSIHRTAVFCSLPKMMALRQLSDMTEFRSALKEAKDIVIITGSGINVESGIPASGATGGYWRKYHTSSLATTGAFLTFPSLVWEYYHYKREIAAKAKPNAAHTAIAEYEAKYGSEKKITVITQNVDGLHAKAGTKNLIELLGSLYKTQCIKCKDVLINNDNPICEALKDRGTPDVEAVYSSIPEESLPRCLKSDCGGLLRPYIVWGGESLEPEVVEKAEAAMSTCQVCMVVGLSSEKFPAALYAPEAATRGTIVAEFNIEPTRATRDFHYYFEGPCGSTLPLAFSD